MLIHVLQIHVVRLAHAVQIHVVTLYVTCTSSTNVNIVLCTM